jgi:tetrahydromethanopterin S-methyltransferase subunit G
MARSARSVGRTMADAAGDAGHAVSKAAARTREEVDDMWAEARTEAGKDTGRDAAVALGLVTTVALGAIELPVAAAIGAGYALLRRR